MEIRLSHIASAMISMATFAANPAWTAELTPPSSSRESVDAASNPGRWRLDPGVSFAARSDYLETTGQSVSYATLAATGQLRLVSQLRPYSFGVLVECASVQERGDSVLVAGMWSYRAGHWSLSFAPYIKWSDHSRSGWKQQTTARYRIGARSALGVELVGPLERLETSRLMVGYYVRVSEAFSISTTIGSAIGPGPERAARTSIVWHLR